MPPAQRSTELITILLVGVLASRSVVAGQGTASASDVKAAYLNRFGQFIESPVRTGALTVCVAGDEAVAAALEKLSREDAAAEKTLVRRDAVNAIARGECGLLFIGHDEAHAAALLKALGNSATLSVGDDAAFLRVGGMVAFTLKDRKVHFSINLANVQAAHLKLSSDLLRHAVEVIQ